MSEEHRLPAHIIAAYGENADRPFASLEDQRQAFADPLYETDETFRKIVALRLALTNGMATEGTHMAHAVDISAQGVAGDVRPTQRMEIQFTSGMLPEGPNPSLEREYQDQVVNSVVKVGAQQAAEADALARAAAGIRIVSEDGTTRVRAG